MKSVALVAMLFLAAAVQHDHGPRDPHPGSASVSPLAAPSTVLPFAGMQAHLDTLSGTFVDSLGFEAEDLPPGLLDSLNTEDDGLVEEAAPGGGFMVRTAGRYHNIFWGSRDSTGAATGVCLSPKELEREVRRP
jgi:hypothetical protein